jgi:hypothetical protein
MSANMCKGVSISREEINKHEIKNNKLMSLSKERIVPMNNIQ